MRHRQRRFPLGRKRRAFAFAGLLLLASLSLPALAKTPGAVEILKRSEDVRAPDADYAVDFTIGLLDTYTPGVERKATYAMVAHGKNESMVVMLTPASFYGGTMLITSTVYYLLLPKATRSFQLSGAQILQGDASNGDLTRANLMANYTPRLDGEEEMEGEKCWRLDLTRQRATANYPRIVCWITKSGYRPKMYEYYGESGAKLKISRYGDYKKGVFGQSPMRIVIENTTGLSSKTTLTFENLRKINASRVSFTPEGEMVFRDAVLANRKGEEIQIRLEEVIASLPAVKN